MQRQRQAVPPAEAGPSDQTARVANIVSAMTAGTLAQENVEELQKFVDEQRARGSIASDFSQMSTADIDSDVGKCDAGLVARKNAQYWQRYHTDPTFRQEFEEYKRRKGLMVNQEQLSPYAPDQIAAYSPSRQNTSIRDSPFTTSQHPRLTLAHDPVSQQQVRSLTQTSDRDGADDLVRTIEERRRKLSHALERSMYHANECMRWQAEIYQLQAEMNSDAAKAVASRAGRGKTG